MEKFLKMSQNNILCEFGVLCGNLNMDVNSKQSMFCVLICLSKVDETIEYLRQQALEPMCLSHT